MRYLKDSSLKREFKEHQLYIRSILGVKIAKYTRGVLSRYVNYMIDSILHGYPITIRYVIRFSLVKIPISEISKYRVFMFYSKYTSDWAFFIDITSKIFARYHLKYRPTPEIRKKVSNFLNSEKVYELIR